MTEPVKFYYNLLSQSCRALYMFLEGARIPYEPFAVSIHKGSNLDENKTAYQNLPMIDDRGFKLSETIPIFRFLTQEKLAPEHWYPRNYQIRQKIDQFLEWQQGSLKVHTTNYFENKWLLPTTANAFSDPSKVLESSHNLEKCLDEMENDWLNICKDKYLFGSQITFVDLLAICEIDQSRATGFDPLTGRKKLLAWYETVQKTMDYFYDDAVRDFYRVTNKSTRGRSFSVNA